MIPMGISQITTSILNSLNQESKTFIYYIISSIALFACILILPKYVGIYALMFGLGLSMLITAILNIIKINKTINSNKTYLGIICKLVIILIPCTLLTKFIYNIIILILPNFITLIICGLISVIGYSILMVCFGIVDISFVLSLKPRNTKKLGKQV